MRRRPRDFPADSGMGRRMSFARRWRAQALGLVFVIAFLAVAVSVASTARAAPRPIEPAAAMTVTVVLDKSSYLSANPASVTATDRGNSTQALATIAQASGFVLGVTFDKPSYVPGGVIHARLALTARGPASWPSQFRWSLTIGAVTATAITTAPAADFTLTLPGGTGGGGIVLFASEASTGATAIQSVPVATGGVGFWSTDVGGAPVYAIVLGLLFLLVLVGVVGLWRRTGGGFRFLHRGTPPPPPEGPTHASAATPMSVNCRRCAKPIDLTANRRPIEAMRHSCGGSQVVTRPLAA